MIEKTTFLRPRLSEKTFGLANDKTVYAFDVPATANKQTVARAVAAQFEVTVIDVRMLNIKGKAKRTVRKGGRAVSGSQSDRKKAYVTLKAGDKLPFFQTEEDEQKKAKKAGKKSEASTAKPAETKKKSLFSKVKKTKEQQ
jgi:large subunit ribosomal protein L23